MEDLWQAILHRLEDLRGIYMPSNGKELVDMSRAMLETLASASLATRNRLNRELRQVEPVFLVLITTLCWIGLNWVYKLVTYEDFVPTNKRVGWLQWIRKLPLLRTLVEKQMRPLVRNLEKDLKKDFAASPFKTVFPTKGINVESIMSDVRDYLKLSTADWKTGHVSGTIYSRNDIVAEQMVVEIYSMTMKSNHLHADVFSGVRKMEAELIRWVLNLFHGDAEACGSISTGGTESIVLACKSYRDFALKTRGVTRPELLVPVTAHAAFDKAADWLRLEIRKVPLDLKTMKVDVKKMRKMINSNTILIVGSAPGYPHGIVDPIEEIAELGRQWNIPVHVDCCLGGFIMPFMEDAGFPVAPFDFRVPGVTSISADTHKYAMAPKGTSVIMYAHKKYLHCQFSVAQDWPGGIYVTPTICGSRSGAVVACCWATLRYHGYEGYVKACRDIVNEARKIREGIRQIEGLRLLGEPEATVVAFTSDVFNIFELNVRLSKRRWHLNPLQSPSGVHFCLTAIHVQNSVAERFLKDVRELAEEMINEPEKKISSQAAVYGLAQTIPDRSIVEELLFNYMDVIYSTDDLKTDS